MSEPLELSDFDEMCIRAGKAEARVAELEEDKKNLLGIVDSCHKKIAELNTKITGLERKQCDCGMKS